MKKQRVLASTVSEPSPGMWSNCLRVGNFAYISGLTARARDGQTILGKDSYEQAQAIFTKMRDLMSAAGGCIDDVVKMTIFVTDISSNGGVWNARKEFFTDDFPACSLVEVSALASPSILVEIEAIGHIGCSTASEGNGAHEHFCQRNDR